MGENQRAGLIHTARLLWEARENLEEQHAIYILASLWNKHRELPYEWRGKVFQFIMNLFGVIRDQFPNIGGWHHRSKDALPVTTIRYTSSGNVIVPYEEMDLVYLAALESIIAEANWQLVRYVDEPITASRLIS